MAGQVKERLLSTLERLPEFRLKELLDFADFLLSKEKTREKLKTLDLDPEKDPILKFIGGVSHGSLAKDIDLELYGGEP